MTRIRPRVPDRGPLETVTTCVEGEGISATVTAVGGVRATAWGTTRGTATRKARRKIRRYVRAHQAEAKASDE